MTSARRYFLLNICSNVLAVVSTSLVGIWLTPYLMRSLGLALYGMVPLVTSISNYFGLLNMTVSSSVGRFVALNIDRNDVENSNIYYNTAIFGIILICAVFLLPILLLSNFLPNIINVPAGYETEFKIMFMVVIISTFVSAITSSFQVSTFVANKFYVYSWSKIGSRLLQIVLIVSLFSLFRPSLTIVGLAILGMSSFLLISMIIAQRKLTPQLRVNFRCFRGGALREMGGMGGWIVIDQIGSLLYLNSDLIIINLLLGPEEVGRYAPVLQLVMLLRVLAPAVGGVFAPVAINYIAHEQMDKLAQHTKQAIKFMGLLLALPAGLACGLAEPFLGAWLGPTFTDLVPLVWLLLLPQVLFLSINPLFNINRGLNQVKVPALMTLAGGLINILVSVFFVSMLGLGLQGVAFATVLSFSFRSVFFLPAYTARSLHLPAGSFLRAIVPGAVLTLVVFGFSLAVGQFLSAGFFPLLVAGVTIGLISLWTIYAIVLNKEEQGLVLSLVGKKSRLGTASS